MELGLVVRRDVSDPSVVDAQYLVARQAPDGISFDTGYDMMDRATGIGGITTFAYNAQGRRASNFGGAQQFSYDGIGRLASIFVPLGQSYDWYSTFGYNPAGQIVTQTRDNDAYAYTGHVTVDRSYAVNGLNQYTGAGPAAFAYDANGNLIGDGTTTYLYDAENRLVQASNGATLLYDPLGRLFEVSGGAAGITRFVYDGDRLTLEYGPAGNILRRHVHGPDADEPVAWFEGSGVTGQTVRYTLANHQGSIVLAYDGSFNQIGINAYDEYGIPRSGNVGRFQYTGQAWIPELGMYYYKVRIYSPTLGRFLQTDPIGYDDQVNLYAYVGNDPVNQTDPSGECPWCVGFVVGAGVEALSEYVETGKVDLSAKGIGRLAVAGAAGALGGGIGAGVAKISANIAVRAAANAAAGSAIGAAQTAANAKIAGHGVTAGQLAKGAALGAAGAGAGSAASDAIRGGARVLAEKTGVDVVTRQGQVATSTASSNRDSVIRGGATAAGNTVGSSPGVADAARNRCVGQRDCN